MLIFLNLKWYVSQKKEMVLHHWCIGARCTLFEKLKISSLERKYLKNGSGVAFFSFIGRVAVTLGKFFENVIQQSSLPRFVTLSLFLCLFDDFLAFVHN